MERTECYPESWDPSRHLIKIGYRFTEEMTTPSLSRAQIHAAFLSCTAMTPTAERVQISSKRSGVLQSPRIALTRIHFSLGSVYPMLFGVIWSWMMFA